VTEGMLVLVGWVGATHRVVPFSSLLALVERSAWLQRSVGWTLVLVGRVGAATMTQRVTCRGQM